jgi:hypothetical protein
MLKTIQTKYKRGNIRIPSNSDIPENSTIYISYPDNENPETEISQASDTYLYKIWNNNEDDIYEQLLNK